MKKRLLTLSLFVASANIFSQTITLKPNATEGKDAFSYMGYNQEDVNYGNNVQFIASAWTVDGTYVVQRSFIDFDWTQLPENAVISSAVLKLYAWNNPSSFGPHSTLSGSNEMVVERITSAWQENTLTYNNMPSVSSVNSFTTTPSTSEDEDYSLDVTAIVQDILDNPNEGYGIAIRLQNENYYRKMNFCSSDHSDPTKWPEITITYQLNDINEFNKTVLSVSNPVNDQIKVSAFQNSKFQILDFQGRIVMEGNIENNTIFIDKLEASNYLLLVDNKTFKITKL